MSRFFFLPAIWATLACVSCGSDAPKGRTPNVIPSEKHDSTKTTGDVEVADIAQETDSKSFSFSTPQATSYSTKLVKERNNRPRFSTTLKADGRLNQAAQTIAEIAETGLPVTVAAIREALWWHGIPEVSNEVALFKKSSEAPLEEDIEAWLARQSTAECDRYGFAIREITGGVQVVAITTKSSLRLLPVRRRVNGPRMLKLKGNVKPPYKSVSFAVSDPEGKTFEPQVQNKGDSFSCSFRVSENGIWQIEILGNGPRGPTTLVNFPVAVGVPVRKSVTLSPLKLESKKPEALEKMLLDAINRERQESGHGRLELSKKLTKVARKYSTEMAESGIVAHISPDSGSVADRIRAARIWLAAVSENLARAGSAREAHDGLMQSPAHRANILNPRYDHVGIGVALVESESGVSVLVTQIFARERTPIEPKSIANNVFRMINDHRAKLGRRKLAEHPFLTQSAKEVAKNCFKEEKPRPESIGSLFKKVKMFGFKTNSPDVTMEDIKKITTHEESHIGIGVGKHVDPALGEELICVIVLLGQK
ncbi:MAG: hypothetical protein GY847_32270 [Proteobacteria bacterium]|nr:hypothetical protein [Pseudomonadota bacterium]